MSGAAHPATSRRVSLWNSKLHLEIELPEDRIRACVSAGGVLHLQRPYASASVCGRQAVGTARKREIESLFSLAAFGARVVCPYCLAWAQGNANHQKNERRAHSAWKGKA